jgi:HEAT repeat protein
MALADKVYEWLANGPTPGSERALADALRYAEPAYFDRLANCLIGRRTPAAWSALISRYTDLSADIRIAIKAEPDLVMAGISTAMKSGEADVRMNALEAYSDTPSERLSHLLPEALRDPSLPVRSRAADGVGGGLLEVGTSP